MRERLGDILEFAERIQEFTASKSLGDLRANTMLRDAVERNLEKISEASRHVPASMKERHPEIPWRSVADLGNVFRHAYQSILDERVWSVVVDDLDPLKAAVRALLEDLGPEG